MAMSHEEEFQAQASEIGDEEEEQPAPREEQLVNQSQRRRRIVFQSFLDDKAEAISEEINYKSTTDTVDGELLTLRDLHAEQAAETIIASPREYQMELFERAKQQNTIAVLDTGSGKTLIAMLLLRHVLDQELENRAVQMPHKLAWFVVDKVNLVFQQCAVINTNLNHKAIQICGAMHCDLWSKEQWDKYFSENMIIVCTADVLLQCLMHSFIGMNQINLLIFDEAHHAKKDHAYARIIREFYLDRPELDRPRIFGMTASPVDVDVRSGTDIEEKAMDLEQLLDSTIATASDTKLLGKSINRPREQIIEFHRAQPFYETALFRLLKENYSDVRGFDHMFETARSIGAELGQWCSDMYWPAAFSERQAKKSEARNTRLAENSLRGKTMADLEADLVNIREARELIAEHDYRIPTMKSDDLSPKVQMLAQYLGMIFDRPNDTRCLVFVQTRASARILNAFFTHLGGPHLRPGVLVGSTHQSYDGCHYTFKQQSVTLRKFKRGGLNCLFATSVAEEGLDIQDCNVVVRFDVCTTMIQYIQSRGRARHQNSQFVHMLQKDNVDQMSLLADIKASEVIMRNFCNRLPQDRLLGASDSLENALSIDKGFPYWKSPLTGAKLTFASSLQVISHFASSLPHHEDEYTSPQYTPVIKSGKFVYELNLPQRSPIQWVIGKPYLRKLNAKKSAAFEMCCLLIQHGYINHYLISTYTKLLPAMRNARLALGSKKSSAYEVHKKPAIWKEGRDTIPQKLFLTIISLPDGWDHKVQPIGLLTRTALPDLPCFQVFGIKGMAFKVQTDSRCSVPLNVNEDQMSALTGSTLQIYKDIFNKTFEHDTANMSYWVAPLLLNEKIDWDTVNLIHKEQPQKWYQGMDETRLIDRLAIDPWNGGRRLFTKAIAQNLKPSDPKPEDMAVGGRKDALTILDYSINMFRKSKARRQWESQQPVLESVKIMHRLNVLADPSEAEQHVATLAFICPEPFEFSMLPAEYAATCLIFPAIIHRLESYLIALEFCQKLQICVPAELALEAITKDSDNTNDSDSERINFRRGMGPNYERLEFLGDCFLKMATSIVLYAQHSGQDEYEMHVNRMLMLCNQNLFDHSIARGYFKYTRALAFSRRTWYPEGLKLLAGKGAGKPEEEIMKQALSQKTIADVSEALIGAAFMAHHQPGQWSTSTFDSAVRAVTKLCNADNEKQHTMHTWAEYYEAYTLPKYQTSQPTAGQVDLVKKAAEQDDYRFQYPRLLYCAFLHPENPRWLEGMPSYQRLEFLGDSLLDMAAVTHLFTRYPDKGPQWLTEHKMAMVSNKFQGALCVRIGFHRHLRHNSAVFESQIRTFVEDVQEAEQISDGAPDYWLAVKDPPKCLADIVEAYVGAMFVDSKFDYGQVERFFDTHIKPYFEDMTIFDSFAGNHPVTKVRMLLAMSFRCSEWSILADEIPSDDGQSSKTVAGFILHDQVIAHATAANGNVAKTKAAHRALDVLEGLVPAEFRERYQCICSLHEDKKTDSCHQHEAKETSTAI